MRVWKGDEEVGLWGGGGLCVCVSVCMEWGVRVWKGDEEVDLFFFFFFWGGGGGVPYIYIYTCVCTFMGYECFQNIYTKQVVYCNATYGPSYDISRYTPTYASSRNMCSERIRRGEGKAVDATKQKDKAQRATWQ